MLHQIFLSSIILYFTLLNIICPSSVNAQDSKTKLNKMETTIDEFYVIGISVRTTNKGGQSQKDVGDLWTKFMSSGVLDKIPNKVNVDVYSMYTDYETDYTGPYTTIIGCKVSSLDNIPEGLVGKKIPTSKYLIYKSIGKLPESVVETWKSIWNSKISRGYIADYDVYGSKSQDANNPEVETFLSVK